MLKTMVSLIDVDSTIHVEVHDGLVDVAGAALSAEPVTIEQWRAAITRFVDVAVADDVMDRCQAGVATKRSEGGHLIVDMTAKLMVIDTAIPKIPRLGNVQACDNNTTLDLWLPYRIPEDWEMMTGSNGWNSRAQERRQQLQGTWQVDHREVLYGRLAACLFEGWLEKSSQLEEPTQQLQEYWLLTPRDDLQEKTPRQVLLEKRHFIDGDIQDQGQTWSLTGHCPPGLAPSSHAYRFGGFGSHEIILYHEIVAYLLLECERRVRSGVNLDLGAEVRHLEQLQQEWLHQPHQALYDQSPAAMIARERARLPAVVPKGHADEHNDCPICRMMFDNGQPMIWQLDNCALDHCFATSFYDTFEEWQEAQQEWEVMRHDVEQRDRADSSDGVEADDQMNVWQRSHTNMQFFENMPPLEACGVMMFSIGGHMAELIDDLKPNEDAVLLCRQLHEQFDDLHVVLKEQEDVWMIQSAISSFGVVLQNVSRLREDLVAKCADLEEKLDFLCRRYQEHYGQDQEAAF